MWIGCVRCEKFRCDFMARTFALIAPNQRIFHRVSCSIETLPIEPKHYEMHQNMSLGSNGVDRGRSLRKILIRLHGKNICQASWQEQFSPFCTKLRAVTKQSKMHPNTTKTQQYMSLGSNGVGRVHSLRNIPKRRHGTNLCINCTSSTRFAPSFV